MFKVDGKKLLDALGLVDEDTLTSEAVRDALFALPHDERNRILAECVEEIEDNVPQLIAELTLSEYASDAKFINRELKYSDNYLRNQTLRRQLNYACLSEGKHNKGKKKKKKKK